MKRLQLFPIWIETAVAILLALSISTVATVFVFRVEDELQTAQANIENLVDRVASATSSLEQAPVHMRPELLTAFSRATRYITLDPEPIVAKEASREVAVEQRVVGLLHEESKREVRVHAVSDEEAARLTRQFPLRADPLTAGVGPVSLTISVSAGQAGWINVRYRPPEPRDRYWPALVSGLIAVAVALLAMIWTRARFAAPLQALTRAASALRRGEPVPSIPETGPSAVRMAAQSFNAMSQRLTATLENQRAIMVAVAHDLRTPIATMRLRAEFVADGEERERLRHTLDEMQTMAEGVLAAAQADRSGEASRPVDVSALAEGLADDMKEMGHDVAYEPGPAVRCLCRTNEVRRALRNLVENALRYGKRARVSVCSEKGNAVFRVDDDGPGIPAHEMERVFEPFARLETSRSQDTGGYGLGLAIARSIARGHGGDVTLANRAEGGLRATITLPLDG